jgi:cystathionine beta-lyase/cystathionine gamma-synthase
MPIKKDKPKSYYKTHIAGHKLQAETQMMSYGYDPSLSEGALKPYSMTHVDIPAEVKERLGITSNLVRISVGIENVDDLLADLTHALSVLE